MNPDQILLVQQSFHRLIPDGEVALETFFGEIFYSRLFDLQPHFRQMFQTDITKQSQKLLKMLRSIVEHLEQPDIGSMKELGLRHQLEYGVKNLDYSLVGEALIWTLEATLGEDFTPNVREAWLSAYTLLAQTMKPTTQTTSA